ncbi:MEDS domain-containing protein [Krasilnikovia sp. MM14-A1004]|uniref:MEDS domain-containing protein n=1 Tax=Krasilnikovia sp. MM14-A1004 TaxID=3373541 RepID=UPI00399C6363
MADASRVEDLQPGDHACLMFSDSEERLDLVAAFARDGLRQGQQVLCLTDAITPSELRAQLAERGLAVHDAVDSGQLHVAGAAELFLADGSFAAERVVTRLAGRIDRARDAGFAGLRVTADMCWALRPVAGVEELMTYESRVGHLLSEGRAMAVCQYDRQCFDAVTLAGVAANHELALAAATYHDDALLRICRQYLPPGIRVAGEIDYRGVEPLARALAEALALDEHIDVNLLGLQFIDGSAAGALAQAAAALPNGSRMSVRCRAQTSKVLRALGIADAPAVQLVVVDDQ